MGYLLGLSYQVLPLQELAVSFVLEEILLEAMFGLGHRLIREAIMR